MEREEFDRLNWRVICSPEAGSAAVPAEEQATASGAVPTAQLIGGAVGSAGAGAIANVLGFSHGVDLALAPTNGLVLFGAFLPLAVVGFVAAWRLGRS